jgi:predicted RNA-binding Zn ribbon-like protein
MEDVRRYEHEFDLSGGHLALDFANTLSERARPRPIDRLQQYADLLVWGRQSGILAEFEEHRLLREARIRPAEAVAILERAIELREALYRIVSATVGGMAPRTDDLATFNAALAAALSRARIATGEQGFRWDWAGRGETLDQVLWPVARAAAELLTSPELSRVRECQAPACAWLFLDTSRNRSRQWCDMRVCGNRVKARRHYQRTKSAR